jgi:hypothetical protein
MLPAVVGKPGSCTGRWATLGAVTLVAATLLASAAEAQDLEPRRYVSIPVKQNFVRAAFGYSTGEVNISPGLPLEDVDLELLATSLAYLRTMDIGGKAASVDAYLPLVCADGTGVIDGTRQGRSVCGQGDARLRFTYNFIGAPALELGEFVGRKRQIVVGASVQVSAPVGRYDEERLLNIGANRWVLRPELGMSVPLGKWNIEFSAGVRFFLDNDDFLGVSTLSQDPLVNLQAHAVYDISQKQWLSLNGNFFFGGKTFRDGTPTQLRQENSRLGVTWHVALDAYNVIQFTANTGVITRVGNDSTTVSMAWLHRWE